VFTAQMSKEEVKLEAGASKVTESRRNAERVEPQDYEHHRTAVDEIAALVNKKAKERLPELEAPS
ncbi:MAG: hypothetical protein O7D30_09525, partial [Rickettsia endosymbiont of Ixodes persulcatus]|nr:hypothetical protein [Rickettsia endosymbiont of Ixodes persulcatus]